MRELIAIVTLLCAAPALAGDRLERLVPEAHEAPNAALFRAEDHPVATTLIISGAVVTAIAFTIGVIFLSGQRNVSPGCGGPAGVICG